MIKVSELKKRGIEIAVGDTFEGGDVTISNINVVRNHTIFGDAIITAFAPRKDLDTPLIGGGVIVNLSMRGGEVSTMKAGFVHWGGGDIISWMPSMKHLVEDVQASWLIEAPFTQSGVVTDSVDAAITTLKGMGYTFHGGTHWKPPLGVKPVFTKEMADAGESPPVGSSVLVNGIKGEVMLSKDGHGVVVVKSNGLWVNAYVREIFPIPTERDLITSDLQDVIASQGHLSKANITDQIANLIYDAGYRKSDK